eukprot:8283103-Alexandrium_andersonii.AAC.1
MEWSALERESVTIIVRYAVGRCVFFVEGFGQLTQPPPFHCHGSFDVRVALKYSGYRYLERGVLRKWVMLLVMPSSPLPRCGG